MTRRSGSAPRSRSGRESPRSRAAGFRGLIAEMAAPYDDETLERLVTEVVPAAVA